MKSIAAGTFYNLAGRILPAVVALACVPIIFHQLGPDRFGLLNLAWIVVGYFSIFDLGLGRALTQAVAERQAVGRDGDVPQLIWTSLALLLALGLMASLAVVASAPWIVEHALKVPHSLREESITSFRLLGLSLPIVMITAALRGVLEAQREFGLVNALRIPMVLATFIAPLIVVPFQRSLTAVIIALLIGRAAALLGHWFFCLRTIPALRHRTGMSSSMLRSLLKFGGWITVSNVVSPVMVNLDRLIIGSQVSIAAIGYYSTVQQVIGQILIIPGSYAAVLFPVFATIVASGQGGTALQLQRGVRWTYLLLLPPLLVLAVFAREGFTIWLGKDFAEHSTRLVQILCIGALLNGLAQVPFSLIQAAGRADLTARVHVIELIPYLAIVWFLTLWMGVTGTAIAWVLRVAADTAVLFIISGTLIANLGRLLRQAAGYVLGGGSVLVGAAMAPGLAPRVAYVAIVGSIFVFFTWTLLLSDSERLRLKRAFLRTAAST